MTEQADPDRDPKDPDDRKSEDDDGFPSVDDMLGSFLAEASLWPVLIVALGSGGAFGAAVLILTIVDHNPFAFAALLLILGMSIDVAHRARRDPKLRNLAKFVGLVWASALVFSGIAVWTGIAFG